MPVELYVSTILYGSWMKHIDGADVAGNENTNLQKLNCLGPEGATAIKKEIAAFAGVPCRDICPVPVDNLRTYHSIMTMAEFLKNNPSVIDEIFRRSEEEVEEDEYVVDVDEEEDFDDE